LKRIVLCILLCSSFSTFSQIGIKGGFNKSKIDQFGAGQSFTLNSNYLNGWQSAVFANYDIIKFVGIGIEAQYITKGESISFSKSPNQRRNYVMIPVQLYLKPIKWVSIYGGLAHSIALTDKVRGLEEAKKGRNLIVGLRINPIKKLSLDVRYDQGLTNITETQDPTRKSINTKSIQLGLNVNLVETNKAKK
jgi:hypothetical protein